MQNWPYKRWFWLLGSGLILLYSLAIARNQFALVDGRPAFWLHDDMMISMRYASNLATGNGLQWNPVQKPVEGYSNFAWVLVMTAVHLFHLPPTLASLPILLLNLLLAVWVLWLTMALMQILAPQASLPLPFLLLTLTLLSDLFRWTTIGLETTLLTAAFLYLLLRLLRESDTPQPGTFLLIGLLGLIRADGLIYGGLLCLLALWLAVSRRRVLSLSPLIFVLPLAHFLFRLNYYGAFFPNTYYLKLTGWDTRWVTGLRYIGRFLRQCGWAWALSGFWLWATRPTKIGAWELSLPHHQALRPLWLISLPLLLYTLYIGGDDFGGLRFFSPWLPVLLVLLFLLPINMSWHKRPLPRHFQLFLLTLFTLILSLQNGYRFFVTPPANERLFLEAGLLLRDHTPLQTRLGVFWAGTLPYFAERPSIDMLGKNDYELARHPAHTGSNKPGHNKFDYDYSLGQLQPDLIVAPVYPALVATAETLAAYSHGPDAYVGALYQHPLFQAHYAANLVFIGEVPLFIRQDSALIDLWMNGRCQTFTNATLIQLGLVKACWPFQ